MLFFKNNAENQAERLVRDLFLFFKKVLYEVKLSGLQFSFNIVLNFAYSKNKLYTFLDDRSKDMLNFDFLEKGL